MQQLNVNDYFELGKKMEEITGRIAKLDPGEIELSAIGWPLFVLKVKVEALLGEPCALLPASKRAARSITDNIAQIIPDDPSYLFDPDKMSAKIQSYQLNWVSTAISNFETILKNDMPEMSTFAVAQIGIFRTDDLIREPYRQIPEPLRPLLQDKAKVDIIEAGKCLAFRVSTAAAFHSCRAIETCMDQYYEVMKGRPYHVSPNGGNNNWGAKTEALKAEGASEKVTEFLTHIRKQYRNPVTHPEVVVDEHEAVGLFTASLSSISMILGEIKLIKEKDQLVLPGIAVGLIDAVEDEDHDEA